MSRKTTVILRSTPCEGGSLGGVNTEEANMKREAWSERSSRTKNWMIVGTGNRRFGMGGNPSEREERDRKTNDWSDISNVEAGDVQVRDQNG
jgi:hypothetical protein